MSKMKREQEREREKETMWKIFEILDNYRYLISSKQLIVCGPFLFLSLWSFSSFHPPFVFLTAVGSLKSEEKKFKRKKILEIHCLTTIVHYPMWLSFLPFSPICSSHKQFGLENESNLLLKCDVFLSISTFMWCSFYRVIDKTTFLELKKKKRKKWHIHQYHHPSPLYNFSFSCLFRIGNNSFSCVL